MTNKIQVLGAYGAKSEGCGTTSFMINEKNIIDAGNLLLPLGKDSAKIETIWLTHSHLDHIVDIAFILDNYYDIRTSTLRIMAHQDTIDALKKHFFNNTIWPDFSKISLCVGNEMVLTYEAINISKEYRLDKEMTIKAFLGDHSVTTVGHILSRKDSSILLSSDTYSLEHIVKIVNDDESIRTLVIECSFPETMSELAKTSKHLTAKDLFTGLKPLENMGLLLYINHIKPEYKEQIEKEIIEYKGDWKVILLNDGDTLTF